MVCNHAADCSETIKRRNRNLAAGIRRFLSSAGNGRAFYAVEYIVVEAFDLPKKFSGVGAARKIGMDMGIAVFLTRSEERRVGKECRSRWSPYH